MMSAFDPIWTASVSAVVFLFVGLSVSLRDSMIGGALCLFIAVGTSAMGSGGSCSFYDALILECNHRPAIFLGAASGIVVGLIVRSLFALMVRLFRK